ncbi:MAG: TOBE domain-containing protein [Vitreoscilla sp.]|nr:TOBE domain-containing protein [Burkholderiales bacterium]MBP6337458.1 TOBE domain-containing protein [Vitreoscilla sp.]MBP6676754.1 TOBE domain-containing protein [Vitreoscilla sp.]
MKISARNVFEGTITSVKEGSISAEVELKLATGETLVAGITEGSVRSLGLAVGKKAQAIVKAPLVLLATHTEGWKFTARNQLTGKVSALQKGAVNASVTVKLAGGASLASIVTNGAIDDLALAVGSPVTALFKADSVVLAVHG